jgi:hypothetical protein
MEDVPQNMREALGYAPTLDDELVAALRGLTHMRELEMVVGNGTLLPQIASMKGLEILHIEYYCLRGQVPASLLTGAPIQWLTVKPVATAIGASDPLGGLCGIQGTLPSFGGQAKLAKLDLSNNHLSNQLPAGFVLNAYELHLQNNMFTGSIPGAEYRAGLRGEGARVVNLSGNRLEVRQHNTIRHGDARIKTKQPIGFQASFKPSCAPCGYKVQSNIMHVISCGMINLMTNGFGTIVGRNCMAISPGAGGVCMASVTQSTHCQTQSYTLTTTPDWSAV